MNLLSALSNPAFYSAVYSPYQSLSRPTASVSGSPASSAARTPGSPALSEPGKPGSPQAADSRRVPGQGDYDTYECQTCKNRKYQDGSNDPCVSFKTPTKVNPERAAFAIRAHEAEHVAHAWAKAQQEDEEIISQSVSYQTAVCPECGRTYMAGGTTRTVFRSAPETYEQEPVKVGANLDLVA